MEYFEGDIVELMNFYIHPGGDGYYINQYGFIPKVGERFRVAYDSSSEGEDSLVSVHSGLMRNIYFKQSQIFLYKRP